MFKNNTFDVKCHKGGFILVILQERGICTHDNRCLFSATSVFYLWMLLRTHGRAVWWWVQRHLFQMLFAWGFLIKVRKEENCGVSLTLYRLRFSQNTRSATQWTLSLKQGKSCQWRCIMSLAFFWQKCHYENIPCCLHLRNAQPLSQM